MDLLLFSGHDYSFPIEPSNSPSASKGGMKTQDFIKLHSLYEVKTSYFMILLFDSAKLLDMSQQRVQI